MKISFLLILIFLNNFLLIFGINSFWNILNNIFNNKEKNNKNEIQNKYSLSNSPSNSNSNSLSSSNLNEKEKENKINNKNERENKENNKENKEKNVEDSTSTSIPLNNNNNDPNNNLNNPNNNININNIENLINEAEKEIFNENFNYAIDILFNILELIPTHQKANSLMGFSFLNLQRPDLAENFLFIAVNQSNFTEVDLILNFAESLKLNKKYDLAILFLYQMKLINLLEESYYLFDYFLGTIYELKGDYLKAHEWYLNSAILKSNNTIAWLRASTILFPSEFKNVTTAEIILLQGFKYNPTNADLSFNIGKFNNYNLFLFVYLLFNLLYFFLFLFVSFFYYS